MACSECKLPYPDDMLNKIFLADPQGSGYSEPVCGICALAIINRQHGQNRKKFTGVQAEEFRQRAIAWRRKHGQGGMNG